MFKTRLISGIVLVAAALLLIISGGYILYFTMLILSLIAAGELYRATRVRADKPFAPMDTAGYTAIVLYYIAILFLPNELWLLSIICGFLIIMFVYVFSYPRYSAFQTMATVFGIIYCGVMLSYIYQTRMLPGHGRYLVWLIFLSAWGCDTCAYCVGSLIGKHKMSPILSPKKSIEGAIGGVAGAIILGILCTVNTWITFDLWNNMRGRCSYFHDRRSCCIGNKAQYGNKGLRKTYSWAWRHTRQI